MCYGNSKTLGLTQSAQSSQSSNRLIFFKLRTPKKRNIYSILLSTVSHVSIVFFIITIIILMSKASLLLCSSKPLIEKDNIKSSCGKPGWVPYPLGPAAPKSLLILITLVPRWLLSCVLLMAWTLTSHKGLYSLQFQYCFAMHHYLEKGKTRK